MCGILGIVTKNSSEIKPSSIKAIINNLFNLSESRGKEAAGLAIKTENQTIVFKQPTAPHEMIKSKKYKEILNKYIKKESLAIIGHSRLVTDGDQALNKNNQPVIKHDIVGIHNGIITNAKELFGRFKIKRKYEIDTEIMLSLIHLFLKKLKLNKAIEKVFQLIEGSASIAFLINNKLVLATNTGSLYFYKNKKILIFASEKYILQKIKKKASQIKPGEIKIIDLNFKKETKIINLSLPSQSVKRKSEIKKSKKDDEENLLQYDLNSTLKRCTKCLLPKSFPKIKFDEKGICNYCKIHKKQKIEDKKDLEKFVSKHRSRSGKPDCLVGFSGGRDSSYGLHYIKTVLKMNPIAFTYDWGMVTDLARRNQARLCGELGIEHIIVSANLKKKRENIGKNIKAWLKKPDLGMIPLFMAGDKQYFYYANKLMKQNKIKLMILCENALEKTIFKTAFCGVQEGQKRWVDISLLQKMKLATYYAKQFIQNPAYINGSLLDTLIAYLSTYLIRHDYLFLFNYVKWNEKQIVSTLINNYNWETAPDTKSTWRIGDGTASFYNYIYYTIAGFTENDTFRSNQIREGIISREKGLKIITEENKPRYKSIKWYCDIVGIDFKEIIKVINSIPKLYLKKL